jgi:hypothetical protein
MNTTYDPYIVVKIQKAFSEESICVYTVRGNFYDFTPRKIRFREIPGKFNIGDTVIFKYYKP